MSNRPPKDPSEGGTKEFLAFPKTRIEREVFDRRIDHMRTYPAQRPVSRGADSTSEEDNAKESDIEASRRNVRPARSQNYDAEAESVAEEDNGAMSLVDIPILVRAPTGDFGSSSASLPRRPRAGMRLPRAFREDGQEDDSPEDSERDERYEPENTHSGYPTMSENYPSGNVTGPERKRRPRALGPSRREAGSSYYQASETPPLGPPPGYKGPGVVVARGLSQIGAQVKERREAESTYRRGMAAVVDDEAEDEMLYGTRRDV